MELLKSEGDFHRQKRRLSHVNSEFFDKSSLLLSIRNILLAFEKYRGMLNENLKMFPQSIVHLMLLGFAYGLEIIK